MFSSWAVRRDVFFKVDLSYLQFERSANGAGVGILYNFELLKMEESCFA